MIVMKDGRKDSVEEKNLQVINICYKTWVFFFGGGGEEGGDKKKVLKK